MFPFHFFVRTFIAAAIVSALIAAPLQPAKAASQLKAVPVEKIGDARYMDDAGRPTADTVFHLTFAVNSAATAQIAEFVNSQEDPASANYHKWLTPSQFGAKFGAAASDISTVTKYLNTSGFANVKVWSNNLFVSADVTRAQAEQAFGVTIHGYDRTPDLVSRGYSKSYYAPDQQPQIDAVVAGKLKGLFGLSNVAARIPEGSAKSVKPFVATNGALDPPDISKAYNIDTLHTAGLEGKGVTIAVVSPTLYLPSDISSFFTSESIAEPAVKQITVNGGPVITTVTTATATTGTVGETVTTTGAGPTEVTTTVITTLTSNGTTTGTYTTTTIVSTPDYTGQVETDLDLEVAGGQAPLATYDIYEGPNDGSFDIFNQIAQDDNAQIVSDSWGTDEIATTVSQAYADSYDDVRAQLSAEGITMFVASGDSGAYAAIDTTFTKPSVSVDASSSYVTSVGGTELTLDKTGAWSKEVAWTFNDNSTLPDIGSNGGLSIYYPRPIWQVGLGVFNASTDGYRQVPDVSALAGVPGYNIYGTDPGGTTGSFGAVYGTSGATPLWASAFGLIEEQLGARQGNINPALYGYATNVSTVYHDITSGNNGVYYCTPGWDFVTGWGSADFATLLSAFEGTATQTPVTSSVHNYGSGLQMITIPYSYSGTDLTIPEVLTGMVTSTGAAAYAVAAWNPLTETYSLTPASPANVPALGQGYWARFSSTLDGNLITAGTPAGAVSTGIGLAPGWNMVGDPYLGAVDISNLQFTTAAGTYTFSNAVNNGLISSTLFGYNGSGYVGYTSGSALQPWAGYWIYSNVSGELTFLSP